MPLTGDVRALEALQRSLRSMAAPGSAAERRLLAAVRKELKPAIQRMYDTSDGPDGAWKPRVDGKPALRSRKLAGLVAIARVPGGLVVAWRRAWMLAQDEGHTFAARQAKGGTLFVGAFTRRFLSRRQRAALRKSKNAQLVQTAHGELVVRPYKTRVAILGRQYKFGAHRVGARVLPARHQKPRSGLPLAWVEAIGRGASEGLRDFAESAVK